MISQAELEAVVHDIKKVARAADQSGGQDSDDHDDEQSENGFLPRTYDIERLHADDARDKVFVAILKALAARHNRPSSPKELATCIMKHEFTLLGGATPYATVSSRISQHFKRIFEHSPPRPPILGRVAHEKHTRKYFYYVSSAHEQEEFQRKVRAGMIPTQPVASSGARRAKKPRCMVPAIAVETDQPAGRTRRAASADTTNAGIRAAGSAGGARGGQLGGAHERPRRTSYDGGSAGSGSDSDGNPYARKRFRSVRSAVAHAYPRRRRAQAGGARRPASHSDAGPSPRRHSSPRRAAGKWRADASPSDTDMANGERSSSSSWGAASGDESDTCAPGAEPGGQTGGAGRLPAAPQTTPRASASPDQTPNPPTSSPTLGRAGGDEMQAASPLLLPRSLMALPLFDTGSPPGKDASPSPLVSAATLVHSDDSVVPAHPDMGGCYQHLPAAIAQELGFSFHDLMDAELMSVTELDTLWTTSNPAAASAALEPIPEAREDEGDAADARGGETAGIVTRLLALADGGARSSSEAEERARPASLDSVEPTRVLEENTDEHEGAGAGSKVLLPDPFADIAASAMVATEVAVSPRIVLTIVETVPVYMTVLTTTEPSGSRGKWIVRRHRLLRLVENGYVNASSLLLAGGVASEQERSIVLSLEVGRFKWRRPQSKLYGTWIPLPRARALAATCSLNHRLGPFLNDNLEAYFPAPLPTSFIRHLIMPFFPDAAPHDAARAEPGAEAAAEATAREAGLGFEFQHLVNSTVAARSQSIARGSTFGATARGTPSPSIVQTLAARGGCALGLAGAARAIFGADDRQLHAFLQLLSAEGPMLGAAAPAATAEHSPDAAPGSPAQPEPPLSATGADLRRVTEGLARSTIGGGAARLAMSPGAHDDLDASM
ncbi:hypothetical protein H4S02_003698, partial [Coemansia sp. RSA 2611]